MAKPQLVSELNVNPYEGAYEAARVKLVDVVAAAAIVKTDMKAANDAVRDAQRVAAWAAFELMLSTDGDHIAEGERLALDIADARGIEGKSRDVYAMRGRDMARFAGKIGETADRSKADPFTIAKKLRAAKDGKETQRANDAIHMAEAREMAMAALDMTPSAFDAELISIDGQDAREALSNALELCRKRGEVINALRDAVAVLANADDETKATAREIFSAAFAE